MYKAHNKSSGEDIIILDSRWLAQLEYLRELDRQDALACPGCEQPVRVRAGKIKRWHFAHKHLKNCPFERESPRLLLTRAILYDWLVGKFGAKATSIEKKFESISLRHIDCWVDVGNQTFVYWIFDRLMPPDERKILETLCDENGLVAQFVFLFDLLREDDFNPENRLHLTTTERTFMRQSELDKAWQTHFELLGGSLHYLDPYQETLITYRNLNPVHLPQLYAGKRLETPCTEVLVSITTGEFIHPGELKQLQQRQREIETQQRQAEERLQRAKTFLKGASLSKMSLSQIKSKPIPETFERKATCQVCGTVTSDWVTFFGENQTCICRNCSGRR